MNRIVYILFFTLATLSSCRLKNIVEKQDFIKVNDKDILYTDRIDLQKDSLAILYWPGTSVKINFKGSPWPDYIKDAVERMNDQDFYTLFFPYQEYKGQPEARTHQKMADLLIQFIDKNSLWN